MQANFVPCPHCRNQLIDDGRFAGQVVQCPTCQQQFQMPFQAVGVKPQAAVPVSGPFDFVNSPSPRIPAGMDNVPQVAPVTNSAFPQISTSSPSTSYSANQKAKNGQVSTGTRVIVITLFILGMFGFMVLQIMMEQDQKAANNSANKWYDDGYRTGVVWGKGNRNDGKQFNVDKAFIFATVKVNRETQLNTLTRQQNYETKDDLPKRGTDAWGDYSRGFDSGYAHGFTGN